MDNIHKIPFILGVFASIVVGLAGYKSGVEYRDIYIRMSISMIVFFAVGLYLKKFIIKIHDELKEKEEEALKEELLKEEERLKEEKALKEEEDSAKREKGRKIDIKVEEHDEQELYDEEFRPMEVNTIKLNNKK